MSRVPRAAVVGVPLALLAGCGEGDWQPGSVGPPLDEGAAPLVRWRRYAESEAAYLRAKSEALRDYAASPGLDALWDGDGRNPNAALTVLRHFDSASVVQGLLGERPQTVMIIGYPLLFAVVFGLAWWG